MQKQANFFEQNVQWIALGLGGLFLLYMVYAYVLTQPVTVSVNNKELGPGEVDRETLTGPIEGLKRDIRNPSIPDIPQEDYVTKFAAAIQGSQGQLDQLAGTQIRWRPTDDMGFDKNGVRKDQEGGVGPVTKLPVPPAPKTGSDLSGRSTVTFQDPNWEPRFNRQNDQPEMIEADKDWWSGQFTISGEALAKAFIEAFDEKKIDELGLDSTRFMQTAVIDVELVRQQILPGPTYGKEEVVKPLQIALERPPFPRKDAKDGEIREYIKWSTENPNELIFPPFYDVLSGDPWMPPGEQTDQFIAQSRTLSKEARQAASEQKRQEARNRAQLQQQRRPQPRGRGGNQAMDEMMEMEEFGGQIPQRQPFRPLMPIPGRRAPAGQRPMVAAPAMAGGMGPGLFPVIEMPDLEIIAHDDTVAAGKTYRYKLRYRILNPVHTSRAAAPELAKEFAITSPFSAWTKPVTIRSKVEFFLTSISGERLKFDVFQWKEGAMKKSQLTASAGDAIGDTGWTVVDARGSGRKAYGLVVDEIGVIDRRSPSTDTISNRYLDLLDEVEYANPRVGLNR